MAWALVVTGRPASVCLMHESGRALAMQILGDAAAAPSGPRKVLWKSRDEAAAPLEKEYRVDLESNEAYTRKEFNDFYGKDWKQHWDGAKASAIISAERPCLPAANNPAKSRRRWGNLFDRAIGA